MLWIPNTQISATAAGGSSPIIIEPGYQFGTVVQGTWVISADGSQYGGFNFGNSTVTQNDEITFDVNLAPGTWTLKLVHIKISTGDDMHGLTRWNVCGDDRHIQRCDSLQPGWDDLRDQCCLRWSESSFAEGCNEECVKLFVQAFPDDDSPTANGMRYLTCH